MDRSDRQLQALLHDILPPTTAVTDYAIGLGSLSADEQFSVSVLLYVHTDKPSGLLGTGREPRMATFVSWFGLAVRR